MGEPRILLFDIENAPSLAYIWGLKNDYISYDFVSDEWYVMCWAAKWLGSRKIYSSALPDHKLYKKDPTNDREVLKALWKLLDEADIVVAHNGMSFDRRKVNARFIFHGITPPSPYRMIDTLLVARKHFMFTSNRLGDIGKFLKIGQKIDTGGFKLWRDCMLGKPSAWKKMVTYCKGDITLLEKVYKKLRVYMVRHPNLAVFKEDGEVSCSRCGCYEIEYRGYAYTNTSKYKKFKCLNPDCGGWGRLKINEVENKTKVVGI